MSSNRVQLCDGGAKVQLCNGGAKVQLAGTCIDVVLDPATDCGCDTGGIGIDIPSECELTITYLAGAVRTGTDQNWNEANNGPCQSLNPPVCRQDIDCWRPYIEDADGNVFALPGFDYVGHASAAAAETANIGQQITITLAAGTAYLWYNDNVCGDNEGTVTFRICSCCAIAEDAP